MSFLFSSLILCSPASFQDLQAANPQIYFSSFPKNLQILPRDETNFGYVEISGVVDGAESGQLQLRILRNGELWAEHVLLDLSQSKDAHSATGGPGTSNPFTRSFGIPAELANFDFLAHWQTGTETHLVAKANNLAAGDVYIISGQSNANAADYHGEQLANQHQRYWLRSFGTASLNPNDVIADLNWHLADGETAGWSGSVGTWGLRMGQLLLDKYQIPIAILNGAVGGTLISYHSRNDQQHDDLSTAYGRLLWRAKAAGVDQRAKAFFWYQGESDGGTPVATYADSFYDLYLDWLEDCPRLKQIYLMPVLKGCGNPTLELRDLQRRSADLLPGITVMSVTATNAHDGCHFYYSGYRQLGDRLARLLARDFYGSLDTANITAPNPLQAQFTSANRDQIMLTYRVASDQLILGSDVYQDFKLGDGVPEKVISAVIAGPGQILLTLDQPTSATLMRYAGPNGSGEWLMNARGVGALAFGALPILP